MKIVVFGATGGVGRRVVEQLAAAGQSVTAIVRSLSRWTERGPNQSLVEIPDLSNRRNLVAALHGADAVVSCIGPRSTKDGPVASTATAAILAGMHAAGL